MKKKRKAIMLYLSDLQADMLEDLIDYYSTDAVRAGVSHVIRLALETLYYLVVDQEKEDKNG